MSDKLDNPSPWPHRVALVLACATFPLLWVGGLVTTTKAGMAVPDWPSTYGYNLFLYPWETWLLGPWDLFIEHGHRLLASLIGLLTIWLVAVMWLTDARGWLKHLSVAALALVILQGVLGGVRVVWNDTWFAMFHGCLAPLFFGLTIVLAALTSEEWMTAASVSVDPAANLRLHRFAWLTMGLAYGQLLLGAYLRHLPGEPTPQSFQIAILFHILVALAIVVHVALIAWHVLRNFGEAGPLVSPALWMAGLVAVQLGLGISTWVVKYGWPSFMGDWAPAGYLNVAHGFWQTHIVTAHVAVGAMIFAQSLRLTLWTCRLVPMTAVNSAASADAPAKSSVASRSIADQLVGVAS